MKRQLLLSLCAFVLGSFINISAENDIILLDLSKPTVPAVIEYVEDGSWAGTFDDENYPYLVFSPFKFAHLNGGDSWGGTYWDSFTLSKNGSTARPGGYLDQWGCMAGGGIRTTEDGNLLVGRENRILTDPEIPYLVAYWSSFMEFPGNHNLSLAFDDEYLYEPVGFYIANHPQAYYYNIDGGIKEDGDYFKLIIGGVDAEGNDMEAKVEHYLAWMEDGKLVQPQNWEWVDLSPLGAVKELYFTMESTDNSSWGINTPTYFCMDKLQVRRTIDTAINVIELKSATKVYPTVFEDYLTVESETEIRQIQLCDLAGKVLYTANISDRRHTVSTETLRKGVYLLKLNDGRSFNVHKIIKK